jgi:hypothetical protein
VPLPVAVGAAGAGSSHAGTRARGDTETSTCRDANEPSARGGPENAIVGREHRTGSYCTTPRDGCKPWDDAKCGARGACLYEKSAKRWACRPVKMRGSID